MPTWSAPISLKGVKGDSTPQTLPNDLTPNSVAIAPVSGDSTASALTQRNASGTTVFASDPSGNVTVAGTLNVAGAATLAAISGASLAVSGNETVGGNLSVTGTLTAGALTASGTNIGGDQTVQGNDTVNGTLKVLGATTLGALTASSINDTGTLTVAGGTTLAGLSATTGSFSGQLNASSLVVSGTLTPNGDVNVGGKLTVQKNVVVNGGTQTVGRLTASGGITVPDNGVSVTGGLSTDTLSSANSSTLSGTVALGTTTAAALTTTGNARVNGNFTVTSGISALGGAVNVTGAASLASTLSVTGATTLAGVTASSASTTGNATVGGTLGVSGASTLAAVNATNVSASGTLSAQGATTLASVNAASLAVSGATSTAGITSSGTVAAKNLTLTSGGGGVLTFADGTSLSTAPTAGSGGSTSSSSGGGGGLDTIYMGLHNATNGNYPTAYTANNGYFTNTQVIGGTATTTGSAYVTSYPGTIYSIEVFAVSASNPISVCLYKNGTATALVATSTSSGGSFYALASTSSPISVAAGDQLQLFIKGTTASMTNSCIGWITVQPTGVSGGVVSREAIDMGGYQYGTNSAGGYSATKKLNATAGSVTNASNTDFSIRMPWPGSIVGYSLQQNSTSATTNSIIYSKNGTNFSAISVGSGAGNFNGTHAVGTYTFAAGDKIQLLTGIANGGNTDVFGTIYVQWSA